MKPKEFTETTTTHFNGNVDNIPCNEAVDPSRRAAAAAAEAVVELDPPAPVAAVGRQLCSSLKMKNVHQRILFS